MMRKSGVVNDEVTRKSSTQTTPKSSNIRQKAQKKTRPFPPEAEKPDVSGAVSPKIRALRNRSPCRNFAKMIRTRVPEARRRCSTGSDIPHLSRVGCQMRTKLLENRLLFRPPAVCVPARASTLTERRRTVHPRVWTAQRRARRPERGSPCHRTHAWSRRSQNHRDTACWDP